MSEIHFTERQKESLKLWIELVRYSSKLEQIIDDKLRQNYGQNISRFDVLSQLDREDILTVGELAGLLIASKGNITGLLDRMQKDGLITKQAKPEDRRSFQIKITSKGKILFHDMAEDNAKWVANALNSIDMKSMSDFTKFLNTARTSIE